MSAIKEFKTKFNTTTATIQGSGWGWLGYNKVCFGERSERWWYARYTEGSRSLLAAILFRLEGMVRCVGEVRG